MIRSLLVLPLLLTPALAAPQPQQLPRPDGSLIHYSLDAPATEPAGLIVLAQGSGCLPGAGNPNLAVARAAFPGHIAVIVEKIGVTPDAAITDGNADCPADFLDAYTLSQRIDDYRTVLDHLLAQPNMPRQLLLFGGSEGALAMERLAATIQPDLTILLSGSVGGSFGEMVRLSVPPAGHATIDAGFAAARATPDSTLFSGHTQRFWADILDHRSIDYLTRIETPVLLLYGGRDSAPLQAARPITEHFAALGRCNLTYWEFPALDHGMADPAGQSHLPAILAMAAHWAGASKPAC